MQLISASHKETKSYDGDLSDKEEQMDFEEDQNQPNEPTEGLTDLQKAYRDILNEPVSPTSMGGLKACIRAFKH